jgi:CshA-type fibril repeat protein
VAFTNVIGLSALATGTGLRTGAGDGPCLVDPSDSVCKDTFVIAGEGTWTIDRLTGVPVFDADPAATSGAKTPVTYRVTDVVGQTAVSTLTPVLPIAGTPANDTSINAPDVNQTLTPLSNDSAATGTSWTTSTLRLCGSGEAAPNCSQTSLVVAGEGTYTVNADGSVTFDPLPTFTGTATPVDYQVEDSLGRAYTAVMTPRVTTTPPTANPGTVSLLVGGTATFTVLHGNGGLVTPASGGPALDPTSACLVDPVTNLCGTSVTIAGEGSYTLDPATGVVTYVSLSTATVGTKTPVTYRITDADGFVATQTLTPTLSTATTVNPNTTPLDPGTTPGQNAGGSEQGGSQSDSNSSNDQNSSQSDSNSGAAEDSLVRTGVDGSWAILLSFVFIATGLFSRRRARSHGLRCSACRAGNTCADPGLTAST